MIGEPEYRCRAPRLSHATMRTIWILLVLVVALAAPRAAFAQVPPELEAAIHLKVLSFDAGLKSRLKGETLTIAVLQGVDKDSQASAAAMVAAFGTLGTKKKLTVHGKAVRVVTFAIGSDLADRVSGAHVLYVAGNVSGDLLAIVSRTAEAKKQPTLCGSRGYLSGGVAVAVVAKSDKPAIVVHAGNAKRTGMLLDAKFLRLAEVVK